MSVIRVDKRLFEFVQACRKISDMRGVSASNPTVLRLTIPSTGHLCIIVCGYEEPSSQYILPLNVLWLNVNPSSSSYLRLLRRLEKNTGTAGLVDKWALVDSFEILDILQEYDEVDKERLQATINVGLAGSNKLGLARLSVAPLSSSNPIAVGDNDPRLSDSRTPLPHTHALPPVTQIRSATGVINIDQSVIPEAGMVLYALGATSATWKHLTHSDIVE